MPEHAVIVGKFAPLHKGHQFLIETALAECDQVTVLVYANPDFPDMPQAVRANWIRRLYPQIDVYEPTDPPPDMTDDFTHREYVRNYLRTHSVACSVVYTSETYGEGFAAHLEVKHRLVDIARNHVPVSGTNIRKDLYSQRHFLSPVVYRHFITTVVFMGAESTGKSTLCEHMAHHMNTASVAEYGREHYEKCGGRLTLEDYVHIAETHQRLEDEALMQAREFLFIDTNALTTLFFSYYYNGGALKRLHQIADACIDRYDHYLLCDTDIPFEQDGWRDTEGLREKSQRMILMDLNNRGLSYRLVSGNLTERAKIVRETIRPCADNSWP